MSRIAGAAGRLQSFDATIEMHGHEFEFRLYTRPLQLGEFATIDYYWLDGSQFRSLRSEASVASFRSVVGFWGAAMQELDCFNQIDQQTHYVLAISYAVVCRHKSLQDIYFDAHLGARATRAEASLSDEVGQRIQRVVRSRNRQRLQEEFDCVLRRFVPPGGLMPFLQEALRHWIGNGIVALRTRGHDGLSESLENLEAWILRYRRRSSPLVRTFINMFAYECKAAFYTCYTNAWIGIIPWLREHRQLNDVSERFLRLWHCQNQPVEIPHGRTAGGIIYPTQRGVQVFENATATPIGGRSIVIPTERIGPDHLPDVFGGQVLALHPLSGIFMQDPALCAIAGRYFSDDGHHSLMRRGAADSPRAYWDLIGAILTAAHLYRQAYDRQRENRSRRSQPRRAAGAIPSAEVSEAALFQDYARHQRLRCGGCRGELQFQRHRSAGQSNCRVTFACRSCGDEREINISEQQLIDWLGLDRS